MSLHVKDVAERLSTTVLQVGRLIRGGALRASDISLPGSTIARWRISEEAIAEFLASREHPAASTPKSEPKPRRRVLSGVKQVF